LAGDAENESRIRATVTATEDVFTTFDAMQKANKLSVGDADGVPLVSQLSEFSK
jgi:hypothetical protein